MATRLKSMAFYTSTTFEHYINMCILSRRALFTGNARDYDGADLLVAWANDSAPPVSFVGPG